MPNTTVIITELSQTASKFRSSIVMQHENKFIDVKSILGLFTTILNTGTYRLHIIGPDADEAKKAMAEVCAKHALNIEMVEG